MPRPFFMAMNESNFDLYIHDQLKEAGIEAEYQHTSIFQLQEALRTASKAQTRRGRQTRLHSGYG